MLNTWLISWRNTTSNKKRFFFTLLAIIVGTMMLTAMLIANETTEDVFDYYEDMYVADADYWVLSEGETYPESTITPMENDPAVTETLHALDKQTFFELEGDRTLNERSVRITGVDDQKSSLLKIPVIEGELDNEGIVLPEPVAALLDKEVGDTVRFTGMGEAKVSAITEYTQLLSSPSDWEGAESSSFRVMAPLDLLREWTGEEDALSYVRFQTDGDGEALFRKWQEKFQGTGAYIEPVVADDLQSNDIGGLYTFFYIIAALAIFISGFIVFNMIYTSVIERKKEFAIMKSLGYTKGSVSKLVLIEMVLLALIGSFVGVPLGIWMGDAFMGALLQVFQFDMVYTLNWKGPVLTAFLLSLCYPVLFSLFPIYHAGKVSILLALKEAGVKQPSSTSYVGRGLAGLVLICCVFIDHPISYAAGIAGVLLLFPLLLAGIGKLTAPLFRSFFHYPGVVAVSNLYQQINRNANTAAILAVGVAIILLLSAVIETAPEGYEKEITSTYGGDMRITSEAPWTQDDVDKLLTYKEFTDVEPLSEAAPITWETVGGERRQFSVLSVREEGPVLFEEKGTEDTYASLEKESTIALGERAFDEWGGEIGDSILMNTPNGEQQYEVVDVVKTSHHAGYTAFMKEENLADEFGWSQSYDMLLTVTNNADQALRNQLWQDFGEHLSKVQTAEEEIQSTTSAITGMNELILLLMVIIIALSSVGTANTLLMNTYERRFEIGTMRALGFTKKQVKTMILSEGLLIGLSGVAGGLLSGVLFIYATSKSELMEGFMTFRLPVPTMMVALAAGIVLSIGAAWISSRSASKIDVQASLKEG
ncbi:FtsX-like permease family protein [Halobacillus sp. ACCC02827]|uniref:FtsX-like permease family protein n=1 Tax=Halobacillus sp. ACCC02827 TaxID=3052090 RepID=UPI0025709519|nr:FtsX-like permease family protein [Halobacillus sp. ACCC02827]WJE17050.1 FtsX-like permease family protein [Halobacillus sp. ACCC02827]